jgi:hypothetical protein
MRQACYELLLRMEGILKGARRDELEAATTAKSGVQ